LAVLTLIGCQKEQAPLKVGFVGGLTGRVAGLGVAGRDGVLLAIEEVNRAGGVKGRKLELLSRDDQQQADVSRQVTGELIDKGVVAIIGPMTSAMAMTMQPLVNQARVVLISPTVTTNRLNDQDDHFFRLTYPLKTNAEKTVAYALAHGLKRFAVTIETGNAAFTEDWFESFRKPFEAAGGSIVQVERFKSGAEGGFLGMAERLIKEKPDAVLLLSGAMDAALTAQQLRKLGSRSTLFASEWAFTSDIINFGGSSVEEILAFVTYDPASQVPTHTAFLRNFEQRFGYKPSFAAVLAYESAKLLIAGLERSPQREGLKEALLQIGSLEGLQGTVHIGRYGDAERQTYLGAVRNGQFITVQ
jgi:branched-chain amino acid transport system substrate-binding protein